MSNKSSIDIEFGENCHCQTSNATLKLPSTEAFLLAPFANESPLKLTFRSFEAMSQWHLSFEAPTSPTFGEAQE